MATLQDAKLAIPVNIMHGCERLHIFRDYVCLPGALHDVQGSRYCVVSQAPALNLLHCDHMSRANLCMPILGTGWASLYTGNSTTQELQGRAFGKTQLEQLECCNTAAVQASRGSQSCGRREHRREPAIFEAEGVEEGGCAFSSAMVPEC